MSRIKGRKFYLIITFAWKKYKPDKSISTLKKSCQRVRNFLIFILLDGGITLGVACGGLRGLGVFVVGLEEDVVGAELDGEGPGDLGSRSALTTTLLINKKATLPNVIL